MPADRGVVPLAEPQDALQMCECPLYVLSERSPDSSVVENVAQLAKLYAIGTPSEKEFSVIRGLSRAKADVSCTNATSVGMPE
jgi:hypothetical protein